MATRLLVSIGWGSPTLGLLFGGSSNKDLYIHIDLYVSQNLVLFRVPMIRILIYWGLTWGSLYFGKLPVFVSVGYSFAGHRILFGCDQEIEVFSE